MSVKENKETIRRWFTETIRGGTDEQTLKSAAEKTISPCFVDHDGPDPEHGYEVILRVLPGFLRAFPDLSITVEQLIGEGDMVAVRLRGEATHTGEAMGRVPTGKHITWTENEIFHFEDGRVVESWGEGSLDEALAEVSLGFRAGPGRN
jgi:predicted ester cyclase